MVRKFFRVETKLRNPRKLANLIRGLGGMVNRIQIGSEETVAMLAKEWQGQLKKFAPVGIGAGEEGGHLRDGIVVEKIADRTFVGIIPGIQSPNSNSPYWIFQEEGVTKRMVVWYAKPDGTVFRPWVEAWAKKHKMNLTSKLGWKFIIVGGPGSRLGKQNKFISKAADVMIPIVEKAWEDFEKEKIRDSLRKV